jgi:hypothetical protein
MSPVTVKPAARVACSIPVLTVTVLGPGAAAALIVNWAVAVVAFVTVIDADAPAAPVPTAIPAPKFAEVLPCSQLVNLPASATEKV